MTHPPLPLPGSLGLIQYAGVDMHAYADTCNAELQERVRVLRGLVMFLETVLVDLPCDCISDQQEMLKFTRAALKDTK